MWMRSVMGIAVLLLLTGCGQSMKEQPGDGTEMEPTVFTKKLDHDLEFTVEIQYEDVETAKEQVSEGEAGSFQLGEPLQLTAKVKNTGDKDYSFEGDPCTGKLTVSLHKDTVKAAGEGDITADFCIQSLVSHSIKAGETKTAKAVFPLDKGMDSSVVDPAGQEVELEPGKYIVSAHYAMQVMDNEIELYKRKE